MSFQQITYGTVTLPLTRMSVETEIVYADDRATAEGVVYHFTVRGVLAGTSQSDFAAKLQTFKCQLHSPRRPFSVRWSPDNVTWSTLYTFDNVGSDVEWGPKPSNVSVDTFSGGLAATYCFNVSVRTKECFPQGCGGNLTGTTNVLSLTANYSHNVNADGFTTRTISGRLSVTSATAGNGKPADYFRYLVTPQVPANFKRTSQSFQQSADACHLDYSITDQEAMWTLPQPLSDGRADFTVHVRDLGGLIDYHLSGRFSAPANVDKSLILQRIGELLLAKFPSDATQGFMWTSRSVTDHVYENAVSFNFSAHAPGIPGDPSSPNWLAGFGGTPPGSNGTAQFVGPYGGDGQSISSGVKAGNFSTPYDACTGLGGLNGNTSLATNLPGSILIPGDSNSPTPSQSVQTGSQSGSLSADHYAAPYVAYHERYSFVCDEGITPLDPKATGAKPVFVRTRIPTLTITQAGYCTRDCPDPSQAPVPPPPFGGNAGVTLLNWDVQPGVPEPLGVGGQTRFVLHWIYVGRYNGSIEKGVNSLGLKYPNDPRVTAAQVAIPTMPELVIAPPPPTKS